MSNKAYLHISDSPLSLPAHTDPKIKALDSVVLCCDVCVPLLWIALFRPEDVRRDAFTWEGRTFEFAAPLVAREVALSRLDGSGKRFNELLGTAWDFTPLEATLKAYLADKPGQNISLDVVELEGADKQLEAAISIYAEPSGQDPQGVIVALSTVMTERTALLDPANVTALQSADQQDTFNLMRIIGYGWYTPVHWDEQAPVIVDIPMVPSRKWWQFWR